jgi:PAS domain S-box-containing protein
MPEDIRRRNLDYGWRVALLGAIPILFLLVFISFHILNSRANALTFARENSLQLVRTLEAGISATVQSAEIVLDFAATKVRERSSAEFIALADRWPFIQSVAYIDAGGRVRNAVVRGPDGKLSQSDDRTDLSGQESFTAHLNGTPAEARLYVGDLRRGYLTDTPIIIISKGVWDDTGVFMGVAGVAIRQDAFAQLFKTALPIVDGGIVLFRADGMALYATEGTLTKAGTPYADLPLFRALQAVPEGSFESPAIGDGITRTVAYRVAPRYPLVVAAGIPIDGILAEWRQSALVLLFAVLLSASVIAVLTWSLARRFAAVRAAQEALRESQTKLKDLVECSSDYQWEIDEHGIVTSFAGPGSENFPEIVGRSGQLFFAETSEPNDLARLRARSDQHLPIRGLTIPARGKDGGLRWVRNSSNPIFDADGAFRGYRGIGTDITEVRRQRELIDAQRKTEALGRLASGLAHEINNLLQPILIYSGFGTAGPDHDERAGYFVKIRRAAESASNIVRNALSFARRSPPRREQVDLEDAVRAAMDVMTVRIPSGIEVAINTAALNRAAVVDRTGLTQVLTNLITNSVEAISAQHRAGGQVVITATDAFAGSGDAPLDLAPGRYCRLSVADNGPGIPSEHLTAVFDPFYTTKAQGQGTGLGLSVVAGLVKSWGGAVIVTSTPFEKTEFAVFLPAAEAQLQAAQ